MGPELTPDGRFRAGRGCDEIRPWRDSPFGSAGRHGGLRPRIGAMESVAAMLIVVFQLFFGWCGEGSPGAPPPDQCEASGDC